METKDESEELLKAAVRSLQLDEDLEWVENTTKRKQERNEFENINNNLAVVAQYELHRSSTNFEDIHTVDNDEERTNKSLERELLEEQQYWEVNTSLSKKVNGLKSKNTSSQRISLRQHNIIENTKAIIRHPSFFQFDKSTTDILEMLLQKRLIGPLHNIAGTGQNSVIVFAECLYSCRIFFPHGNAIKIYKLGRDVIKNKAILKRAQREYDHLQYMERRHLTYLNAPDAVHKYRNVIVMSFMGSDQETDPSITSLPFDHSERMYGVIVNLLDTWYNKYSIVHGKLSVKNVRYWGDTPQILGWSHSVHKDHPLALKKLMRDCCFVTKFFKNRGVAVETPEELFKSISSIERVSKKLLDMILLYDRGLWQDEHRSNPNRPSAFGSLAHRSSRFKC